MIIDFSQVIFEAKDEPKQDEIKLYEPCVSVLTMLDPEQKDGQIKYNNYKLANRIDEAAEVEVTTKEIAAIKDLIGKVYAPEMVGRVWDKLEKVGESAVKEVV